ncbi:hypothetical protein TNIN_15091 [Trichonephila inaurata madagascariensis]|uniref:THAP-type domain-containing protein n=1 Tax=Trichonephila inaurata madagascariensis TaxID=2747483 RepID=A0A8X6X8F7_9ARAC|nr:hypothetical protein TNIN_15091 [Trichonephila inaurata madagascariensis]
MPVHAVMCKRNEKRQKLVCNSEDKETWPGKTNFCIEKKSFSLCEKHFFREAYPGIERAVGHRKILFPGALMTARSPETTMYSLL